MQPLITVIVPIYKVEAYLRKCIDSVIAQTYRNLEIILVDDGSPDGCGRICDEYAARDERIRVIHKENGGLSSARNAALDVCRGEYISFIDSDDFVSPYFIEILYRGIAQTGSEIASVRRGVSFYDESEGSVRLAGSAEDYTLAVTDAREAIRLIMYQRLPNGVQWRLYKREIWDGLRFPTGWLFEDAATTHRAFMRAEKIALLECRTYAYRVRADSIVHMKFTPAKLICVKVGERVVGDIMAYDETLKDAAYARAFSVNYQVFIQIPPEDTDSLEKVWDSLLKYRDVVARDKSPELRAKNLYGARCTYLGMRFAYNAGRIYKVIQTKYTAKKFGAGGGNIRT